MGEVVSHYAMIGMAHVAGDYPLYYDAVNEKGLAMAGLNFVGNAVYQEVEEGRENVHSMDFKQVCHCKRSQRIFKQNESCRYPF